MAKKLKASTVQAVGGCQQAALVALLTEMGYEVGDSKPGMYVNSGDEAQFNGNPARILPVYAYAMFDKEGLSFVYTDNGAPHVDHYSPDALKVQKCLTVNGRPVRGYAK